VIAIIVLLVMRVLELVLIGVAVVRSATDRFVLGIAGGLVRGALVVAAAVLAARSSASLIVDVGGPTTTAIVLLVAHLRRRDVPVAIEELRARPFGAWLAVGGIDAMFVAFALFGFLISRDP
jgi:hypothetical protein